MSEPILIARLIVYGEKSGGKANFLIRGIRRFGNGVFLWLKDTVSGGLVVGTSVRGMKTQKSMINGD